MSLLLSEIHIYPLKSAGGIALDRCEVDAFGPRLDRRWMVTDADGVFVSQREVARMALLRTAIAGDSLEVSTPGLPPLHLPLEPADGERTTVRIWKDVVAAEGCGSDADHWVSEALGRRARLVRMPDDTRRPVQPPFGQPGDRTAFTDAFPFLLIGQASLDDLNARLAEPLPMNRFRPNLVVTGGGPFAEDGWARIAIGEMTLRVAKPCARCVVTTTDQDTGARGREPLRTLATYRRRNGKVMFGQNLVHDAPGMLARGAVVRVMEARTGR